MKPWSLNTLSLHALSDFLNYEPVEPIFSFKQEIISLYNVLQAPRQPDSAYLNCI